MKREEIEAMPAGRELDALVAEHLFGWEWLEHKTKKLKALYAPETDGGNYGWVRYNFNAEEMQPADPETKRYRDWDRVCSFRHRHPTDKTIYGYEEVGLPKYSVDGNAMLQVIQKVYEMDYGKVSIRLNASHYHGYGASVFVAATNDLNVPSVKYDRTFNHGFPDDALPLAVAKTSVIWALTKKGML
jgi:hypothetical protein